MFYLWIRSNIYRNAYLLTRSETPPTGQKWGIPRKPSGMQAREKEKKIRKEKKRKENLHKTLERAEDYSEITHMGASREAQGLEWGFASSIAPE